MLYLNDGLGDSSDNTGFFMLTKQGTMQRTETTFDGITPNQIFDVLIDNSNETDVYINNIDAETGEILEDPTDLNAVVRLGEWEQVDIAGGQNIVFTSNTNRNRYEVETLDNDQFRVIFGDGNFANIPSGTFEIWSRQSANTDNPIPTSALQNISSSFNYLDADSKEQTFNMTVSLLTPIQNAAPSEDIEHIRRTAPAVYYTQDRMVNSRDYNEYLLQDNTILKLRAINRTFSGDSKYIAWHDPREYYENVKMFGDDGVIYFESKSGVEEDCITVEDSELPVESAPLHSALLTALLENHIEPLLSTPEFFTRFILEGVLPTAIRTEFTSTEKSSILTKLIENVESRPFTKFFKFDSGVTNTWIEDTSGLDYWFSVSSIVLLIFSFLV